MKDDGITKLIDGDIYYHYHYADYLYQELNKRDKAIDKIKEIIDNYFAYDYKNESTARLDAINKINNIIVEQYYSRIERR